MVEDTNIRCDKRDADVTTVNRNESLSLTVDR